MPLCSIEILVAEHRKAEKVLAELEGLIDEFLTHSEVPAVSKRASGDVTDLLARDLVLHIQKEDQGLFPALGRFFSREADLLAVMVDERQGIAQSF